MRKLGKAPTYSTSGNKAYHALINLFEAAAKDKTGVFKELMGVGLLDAIARYGGSDGWIADEYISLRILCEAIAAGKTPPETADYKKGKDGLSRALLEYAKNLHGLGDLEKCEKFVKLLMQNLPQDSHLREDVNKLAVSLIDNMYSDGREPDKPDSAGGTDWEDLTVPAFEAATPRIGMSETLAMPFPDAGGKVDLKGIKSEIEGWIGSGECPEVAKEAARDVVGAFFLAIQNKAISFDPRTTKEEAGKLFRNLAANISYAKVPSEETVSVEFKRLCEAAAKDKTGAYEKLLSIELLTVISENPGNVAEAYKELGDLCEAAAKDTTGTFTDIINNGTLTNIAKVAKTSLDVENQAHENLYETWPEGERAGNMVWHQLLKNGKTIKEYTGIRIKNTYKTLRFLCEMAAEDRTGVCEKIVKTELLPVLVQSDDSSYEAFRNLWEAATTDAPAVAEDTAGIYKDIVNKGLLIAIAQSAGKKIEEEDKTQGPNPVDSGIMRRRAVDEMIKAYEEYRSLYKTAVKETINPNGESAFALFLDEASAYLKYTRVSGDTAKQEKFLRALMRIIPQEWEIRKEVEASAFKYLSEEFPDGEGEEEGLTDGEETLAKPFPDASADDIDVLIKQLKTGNAKEKQEAAENLKNFGTRLGKKIKVTERLYWAARQEQNGETLNSMIDILHCYDSGDFKIRVQKTGMNLNGLIEQLRSANPAVRYLAAIGLRAFHGDEARKAVTLLWQIYVKENPKENVVYEAMEGTFWVYRQEGVNLSVDTLVKSLNDAYPTVRYRAATGLRQLRGEEARKAVTPLWRRFVKEDPRDNDVYGAIDWTLSDYRREGINPPIDILIHSLNNIHPHIRRKVVDYMEGQKGENAQKAVDALLARLSEGAEENDRSILREIGRVLKSYEGQKVKPSVEKLENVDMLIDKFKTSRSARVKYRIAAKLRFFEGNDLRKAVDALMKELEGKKDLKSVILSSMEYILTETELANDMGFVQYLAKIVPHRYQLRTKVDEALLRLLDKTFPDGVGAGVPGEDPEDNFEDLTKPVSEGATAGVDMSGTTSKGFPDEKIDIKAVRKKVEEWITNECPENKEKAARSAAEQIIRTIENASIRFKPKTAGKEIIKLLNNLAKERNAGPNNNPYNSLGEICKSAILDRTGTYKELASIELLAVLLEDPMNGGITYDRFHGLCKAAAEDKTGVYRGLLSIKTLTTIAIKSKHNSATVDYQDLNSLCEKAAEDKTGAYGYLLSDKLLAIIAENGETRPAREEYKALNYLCETVAGEGTKAWEELLSNELLMIIVENAEWGDEWSGTYIDADLAEQVGKQARDKRHPLRKLGDLYQASATGVTQQLFVINQEYKCLFNTLSKTLKTLDGQGNKERLEKFIKVLLKIIPHNSPFREEVDKAYQEL
ncbi:MAG: hypothetical protein PHW46_04685, partial [Candidatus Omnitrophica bacterium]|nr:hypothetical protein [Candidatus Omnitrophota bacterium]